MKKRFLAALCAAVLLFALIVQAGAAAGDWDDGLIFIAINDNPLPLSADTMPILINGTFYVPYSVFDHNLNGGYKLGLYNGGQKSVNGVNLYTIYSNDYNLNFDLSTGISYSYYPDDPQSPRAVIRNGRIYLSASSLCRYFKTEENQLTFYQTSTKYGYPLIRISNSSAQLPDQQFVNSASTSALLNVLNTYYHSLNPQSTTAPTPSPQVTPPPAVTPPVSPDPDSRRDVRTYLAVRCDTGEATADILDALKAEGRCALLLFPPDQLAAQDDLVRRAVGEGHVLGLLTDAATPEGAAADLARGNELLSHIAYTATRIVLADGGEAVTAALAEQGWLCWSGNVSAVPAGRSSGAAYTDALAALESRRTLARITIDDSASAVRVLTRLLTAIRTGQYDYRLAVETEF